MLSENVVQVVPLMAGEDFSFYCLKVRVPSRCLAPSETNSPRTPPLRGEEGLRREGGGIPPPPKNTCTPKVPVHYCRLSAGALLHQGYPPSPSDSPPTHQHIHLHIAKASIHYCRLPAGALLLRVCRDSERRDRLGACAAQSQVRTERGGRIPVCSRRVSAQYVQILCECTPCLS